MSGDYCEYPGCSRYAYAPEVNASPNYCAYHLFTMDDE